MSVVNHINLYTHNYTSRYVLTPIKSCFDMNSHSYIDMEWRKAERGEYLRIFGAKSCKIWSAKLKDIAAKVVSLGTNQCWYFSIKQRSLSWITASDKQLQTMKKACRYVQKKRDKSSGIKSIRRLVGSLHNELLKVRHRNSMIFENIEKNSELHPGSGMSNSSHLGSRCHHSLTGYSGTDSLHGNAGSGTSLRQQTHARQRQSATLLKRSNAR